jgi:hypothetical protein
MGPDGKPLKIRKIIRVPGLYSSPKPEINETDNSKSFSSSDTKQEINGSVPTKKSNKEL